MVIGIRSNVRHVLSDRPAAGDERMSTYHNASLPNEHLFFVTLAIYDVINQFLRHPFVGLHVLTFVLPCKKSFDNLVSKLMDTV